MIQGSINQLLGLAAISARLDPRVEKMGKVRELEGQLKDLKTLHGSVPIEDIGNVGRESAQIQSDMKEEFSPKAQSTIDFIERIKSSGEKIKGQLMELDPSKENYESFMKTSRAGREIQSIYEPALMRQEATRRAKQALLERQAESRVYGTSDINELNDYLTYADFSGRINR